MTTRKLIQDQVRILEDVVKRLDKRPTRAEIEKIVARTGPEQKQRIEARIARLETQKSVFVARINAAIEKEKQALKLLDRQMPDIDLDAGKPAQKGRGRKATGSGSGAAKKG